jgi:hypothetical protein
MRGCGDNSGGCNDATWIDDGHMCITNGNHSSNPRRACSRSIQGSGAGSAAEGTKQTNEGGSCGRKSIENTSGKGSSKESGRGSSKKEVRDAGPGRYGAIRSRIAVINCACSAGCRGRAGRRRQPDQLVRGNAISTSHQAYRHARLEGLLDHPNLLCRRPAPTALNRYDDLNSIRRVAHRHGCMPHTC